MATSNNSIDKDDIVRQKETLENMIAGLHAKIRESENQLSFMNGILFALEKQEADNAKI